MARDTAGILVATVSNAITATLFPEITRISITNTIFIASLLRLVTAIEHIRVAKVIKANIAGFRIYQSSFA